MTIYNWFIFNGFEIRFRPYLKMNTIGNQEVTEKTHTLRRRLSKDYEYLPENSEAMIYLAMIRLMLQRLATAHKQADLLALAA